MKKKKWNLVISNFPSHDLFSNFTEDDRLILGKSTYLTLGEGIESKVLINSPVGTKSHSYLTKNKIQIHKVPI